MRYKNIILTTGLFVLMFFVFGLKNINAECAPKECNDINNKDLACTPSQQCIAFCCIDPDPGGGGGGGSCPVECKANSCGTGWSGASGCGTCGANQVCCRPNSCGTVPSTNPIKGAHETLDCSVSTGWACLKGYGFGALEVEFYKDGVVGVGTYLDKIYANLPGVGHWPECETTNYAFNYTVPSSLKDGIPHSVYAYGVTRNASGDIVGREILSLSPKSVTCGTACSLTAPTITSVTRDSATSATIKWTPGTAQSGSIQRLYVSQDINQINN